MTDINANLNNAECIVTKANIGSNTFVNICNGTERVVAWGAADWTSAIAVSVLVGTMLLLVVGGICAGLYALWDNR
jgi:hypothetical protein